MKQPRVPFRTVANATLLITAVILGWIAITRGSSAVGNLSPGSEFPSLILADPNGDSIEADPGSRDHLIVFFSSGCEYCQRSLPIYRLLSEMCDLSLTLAFTDLSGSSMADWWDENRSGFSQRCSPVTVGGVIGPLSRYRVAATPTHYLVGSDARVKHHFVGMLAEVPSWVGQ